MRRAAATSPSTSVDRASLDAAAALCGQVRDDGAGDLDRAGEVRAERRTPLFE
jgi:hypothetical protein